MLTSCTSTSLRVIGTVNEISHRNIDSKTNYVLLQAYAGGSDNDLKDSRALTVEDAIDQTVKSIPGGEFLKNAKIYMVVHGKTFYYACVGDVWGQAGITASYNGMKSGDKVTWKNPKKIRHSTDPEYLTGVIVSVKVQDETAIVKKDENDQQDGGTVEVDMDKLSINTSAVQVTQQTQPENKNPSNFQIGDKVTWKNPKKISDEPKFLTGVIISIRLDDQVAIVKKDENDNQYAGTVEVDFDELSRIK